MTLMVLAVVMLCGQGAAYATISGVNAYPNPVTPDGDGWADVSYINFSLARPALVSVKLYDPEWRLVTTVAEKRSLGAGFHSLRFAPVADDGSTLPDGVYWYSAQVLDSNGLSIAIARGGLVFVSSRTGKAPAVAGSPRFGSAYVHPNPGTAAKNPAVRFKLSTPAYVTLKVYDYRGEVRTVLNNAHRGSGSHAQAWDGKDDLGEVLPDGNYRYMLFATAGGSAPHTHLRTGVISLDRGKPVVWRTYHENDRWAMTTGNWTDHSSSVYRGGRYMYSNNEGATFNVNFRGTGFEWIGPSGPQMGKARVFVNGVSHGVVDMSASTFAAQKTQWRVEGLSADRQHSVTIKLVRGTGDTGVGYLGVDSFRVFGLGPLPAAPRGDAVFGYSWPELLVIDKSDFTLYQVKKGVLVESYPIAVGRTNAETPIGTWRIMSKYLTSPESVYGPRKMRMYRQVKTSSGVGYQYTAYNIHGTNQPWVIGTQASAGCIRLYNHDVLRLYPTVELGTYVVTRR